jgi:DNA-binding beta-propeller fold protein YncE
VYVNELAEEPPAIPRIQKFNSNGTFIMQWGSVGTGEGQLGYGLEHLDIDSKDRVYMVNNEDDSEIEVFDTEGNFITKIGDGRCKIEKEVRNDKVKMAQPLPCDGKFNTPEHLNIDDSNGNVWVVDKGNQRIEVFATVR